MRTPSFKAFNSNHKAHIILLFTAGFFLLGSCTLGQIGKDNSTEYRNGMVVCAYPDASLVDRAGFLAQTAKPVTIKGLKAEDVMIRMFGDVAIIHGRTVYTTAEGRVARGRYTDVWAKRGGKWLAVSAHVTRG